LSKATSGVAEPATTQVVLGELLPAMKTVGSYFAVQTILQVVRFVVEGAIAMRAASRITIIVNQCNGHDFASTPSHTTVQNFLLRIGLFVLQSLANYQRDWIWLVDHTHSVGTTKCFVVVGIRLSEFQRLKRPLQHDDLTVLDLIPVDQSNGGIVFEQLSALCIKVGVPLAILSDRGTDLNKGVQMLQQVQPDVLGLYDVVHMVARMTEAILRKEPQWSAFCLASSRCAHEIRQSKISHLKPPRTKTKARYMNISQEIRWGARAICVLDRVRDGKVNARQSARLPKDLVESKLKWLDEYRHSIAAWEKISLMGQEVIATVRRLGYSEQTKNLLAEKLGTSDNAACREWVNQIMQELTHQCLAANNYQSLPGTSEILESLFGKMKRLLSGNHSSTTNSLTVQLLAMVTCTVRLTPQLVQDAIATCRIKHLKDWCKQRLQESTNWARRVDLTPTAEEQTMRNASPPAIANF
jgi:hypothetical protein